jgi:hypothetical protein
MSKPTHPAGPGMTLGNMRELGVQNLIASCLNPSCLHEGLIDVSKYPADTEVPSFARKVVCATLNAACAFAQLCIHPATH